MKKNKKNTVKKSAGFTLIELLVVIAIIALLSSVVLASLTQARTKAQDVSIKSDLHQMEVLLQQEVNDTDSYQGLQGVWDSIWVPANGTCDTIFPNGSNYRSQMIDLCKDVVKNSPPDPGPNGVTIYFGTANNGSRYKRYSVAARLNNGNYWCVGSSGAKSERLSADAAWVTPGCYANP